MEAKRVLLTILDGWGIGQQPEADAIRKADTPFVDSLYQDYPNAQLTTFGEAVGLPEGQMGNSEVGHLNIGAGRIVYQELARINKALREGELAKNLVLASALTEAREKGKDVHFFGLVSDGGVHSHLNHLLGLCDIAEQYGVERYFVHAFTDGRDCDPKSGRGFLEQLQQRLDRGAGQLASVTGRYFAMDRDKRWERIKLAYDAMVEGKGEKTNDILATIDHRYQAGETDEFLKPIILVNADEEPRAVIKDGDLILCFNFRTDRPRQISEVLTQRDFPGYRMHKLDVRYVAMTRYDETFKNVEVLFEKADLQHTLGEVLADLGKTQVRIAETEKYPHVTYFFSGGRENEFSGERRILIDSPKVATYDLQPEMSASGVTAAIVADIKENRPDFICLNYANTDMVGHTGVFEAAMEAARTIDRCLKELIDVALEHDYAAIIIADHGNSDYMINEDGTPNTAHTKNPVPIFYVSKNAAGAKIRDGKLADVAPTILGLMGIPAPDAFDGENLIEPSA